MSDHTGPCISMHADNALYSARSGSCCATLGMPGRMSVGESGCLRLGGGEVAGEWRGPGLCGLFDGMRAGGCAYNLVCRVDAGQGFIWARLGLPAGMAAVQQESTATHMDRGGRAGTGEDGDLRVWTRVDVLP
jgi:hypothetical protein